MGESQYYSMDPFHEGGSISSGKYSEAYYAVYQAMEAAKENNHIEFGDDESNFEEIPGDESLPF